MPELTLRDWMVVVGSLLILAVIVDAFLRMRTQQRERVRMKLAATPADDQPVDDIASFRELPNGGARVVERSEDETANRGSDSAATAHGEGFAASRAVPREALKTPTEPGVGSSDASPLDAGATVRATERATARTTKGQAAAGTTPNNDRLSSRTDDPAGTDARSGSGGESEVEFRSSEDLSSAAPDSTAKSSVGLSSEGMSSESADTATGDDRDEAVDDEAQVLAGVSALDEPANLDWLEDMPRAATEEEEAGALPRSDDSEVIVLHVLARDDGGFSGASILEILLACDLRFGDMSFFHRHEQEAGRGPIQFSVANMLKPGVFDIDNMDLLNTRGLVFFLTLPGPEDMIKAFDYMLETARVVAKNLGGDVLDESRSVLTQQAVEHSKQQIRELERRLLAHQRA